MKIQRVWATGAGVILYSVICYQYSVLCYLYPLPCTLYPVPCTLYSVLCYLCSVPSTLYSVPCTLHSVSCTLYSVLCSLYPVLCTLYSVLCTWRTVRLPGSHQPAEGEDVEEAGHAAWRSRSDLVILSKPLSFVLFLSLNFVLNGAMKYVMDLEIMRKILCNIFELFYMTIFLSGNHGWVVRECLAF